ncbi:MAG: hypothetical protein PHY46_02655 [Candidatus Omnitrophica bacterium]|nr:hypothetical protein [Candidatus Omnitrophota bacterium]
MDEIRVREAIEFFNKLNEASLGPHLKVLVDTAQSVISVSKELPEEKNIEHSQGCMGDCSGCFGIEFNKARSLCLPIVAKLKMDLEQTRVQLAACGVVALGYATGKNEVKKGDYGWSASFQDCQDLWDKYLKLQSVLAEKEKEVSEANGNTHKCQLLLEEKDKKISELEDKLKKKVIVLAGTPGYEILTLRAELSQMKERASVEKLIKVADESLGYNGIGTCMTSEQINKVFRAIAEMINPKKG